ncbi:hypothetical protein KR009_009798, partial [Drosophila setifemur]
PEHVDHVDPHEESDYHDHLTRPDMEYDEYYEEVTFSYKYHNENNDHITFANIDNPEPHHDIESTIDIEPIDDHLTTEDSDHKLPDLHEKHNTEHHFDTHFNYEIEDRIVRYAMHKFHEEI